MKKSLGIFILSIIPVFLFADKNALLFENGNRYYQQKNYEKAIAFYDSVLISGHESSSLYFNRGNAYFKLQKYPLAILNYEKAKKLAGSEEDIDFNLRYANQFIVDRIEPIPEIFIFRFWDNLVNLKSSKGWASFSFVMFWITLVFLTGMLFSGRTILKKTFFTLSAIFLFIFIFTVIFTWKRNKTEHRQDYAIVMTSVTSVKSAPDEAGKEIFIIHEGIKVRLLEKVQDWQKIRLADGKTGWIKIQDFLVI